MRKRKEAAAAHRTLAKCYHTTNAYTGGHLGSALPRQGIQLAAVLGSVRQRTLSGCERSSK
jgi:hypothetical protein